MEKIGKALVEKAFKLLHPRLQVELSKEGYVKPTPIQEKVIPLILLGKNVVVMSPTGTGKTEAAVLPILSKMLKLVEKRGEVKKPLMVYVTPLRALNRDIYHRLFRLSRKVGLQVMVRHGDSTRSERREFIRSPPHWFTTTPESLAMMITQESLRNVLSGIKWIVVDEVHELIGSERGSMIEVVLKRLKRLTGDYQFVGLSATIANPSIIAKYYVGSRRCRIVRHEGHRDYEYTVLTLPRPGVESWSVNESMKLLAEQLKKAKATLIFTNTRDTAEVIGSRLKAYGLDSVGVHHGSLSVKVRKQVEEKFKNGELQTVVATSSLELGIDIGCVDLVIQYCSPRQAVKLVQRVGRSAHRLGGVARGVIITEPSPDDVAESIVIARRALAGLLEEEAPHRMPLDVLVHQAVGMVISGEAKNIDDLLEVLRETYTFKGVDKDFVMKVLRFADETRLLRIEPDGKLRQTRRSRSFYYSTTMIPDQRTIPVYTTGGERIGSLDADFVASRLHEEAVFVLAGKGWRVLRVDPDRVVVEEFGGSIALPPYWEGETIPVSRKVAREACFLIRRVAMGESFERLRKEYPMMSKEAYELLSRVCTQAKQQGFLAPHGDHLVLEESPRDKLVVVYTCLGSKGNEALSVLLAHHIMMRLGMRVEVYTDPYRVCLYSTARISARDVVDVIKELSRRSREEIEEEFVEAVKNTGLFRWRVAQVARKMGCITSDADVKSVGRILRYLTETPVGEEALRELLHEKLDIKEVQLLLEDIGRGVRRIFLQPVLGLSPYTLLSRGFARRTLLLEGRLPDDKLLEALEKRLLSKNVLLKCMKCGWEKTLLVEKIEEKPRCPRCGSGLIAPLSPGSTEMIEAVRKYLQQGRRGLSNREKELADEALKRARLVLSYGKNAILALSAYGVGPKAATRALTRLKLGWKEFLRAIHEEERKYFLTSKYWDA